jgi:hypothetical protein
VGSDKGLGFQLIRELVEFVQINARLETESVGSCPDSMGCRDHLFGSKSSADDGVHHFLERDSLAGSLPLQDGRKIIVDR